MHGLVPGRPTVGDALTSGGAFQKSRFAQEGFCFHMFGTVLFKVRGKVFNESTKLQLMFITESKVFLKGPLRAVGNLVNVTRFLAFVGTLTLG